MLVSTMSQNQIVINTPDKYLEETKCLVLSILNDHKYLHSLSSNLKFNVVNVFEDEFYAENEIEIDDAKEVFKITISSITPRNLLRDVLNVELHKAYLYFTNNALRALRWRAGKIFYSYEMTYLERLVYAHLVDTVENCVVTKLNPDLAKLFLNIVLNEEAYENILDYILSQAVMVAPAYAVGKIVPQNRPDELESLALLLSTYSSEVYEKPYRRKGIIIADELYLLAKRIKECF